MFFVQFLKASSKHLNICFANNSLFLFRLIFIKQVKLLILELFRFYQLMIFHLFIHNSLLLVFFH